MHVPALRFGSITKAVLKNEPRYEDFSFAEDEKLPPGVEVLGYRNKKAYEEGLREAHAKYRQAIDAHLSKLAKDHAHDPNYHAAAIPLWGGTLIVDGPDFDALGRDLLLSQQHFLSAFEAIHLRNPDDFRAASVEQLAAEPVPVAYNWANAYALNFVLKNTLGQAESETYQAYLNKATKTLDITV